MITVKKFSDVSKARHKMKGTVGLVPTMGYLHKGHISLVKAAKNECDNVALSIFVNSLQFGQTEDFEKYPRDFEADKKIAESSGVDLLFAPSSKEMYPEEMNSIVTAGKLSNYLCGKFRHGHFDGVATVVSKLFNITKPHKAYFGRKDYQQYLIIKKMAEDLNFDTEIRLMPIVREADGLAMSSRNTYLNSRERKAATTVYKALTIAEKAVRNGKKEIAEILKISKKEIDKEKLIKVQYFEIVCPSTLQPKAVIDGNVLIAVSVYVGNTRLIDNILVNVDN